MTPHALRFALPASLLTLALSGCPGGEGEKKSPGPGGPAPAAAGNKELTDLAARAKATFGVLPAEAESPKHDVTEAKVALGRMLYFENRLSKNQEISCNTCHDLAKFGVDGKATSAGHKGQLGDRNSPTVYNAAVHFTQFWDGRAADVEEQAQKPITNPVEMACPDDAFVVKVLTTIPGYADPFKAAFPDDKEPITMKNVGEAIGAFERRLMTPGRFDEFMNGKTDALTAEEVAGLKTFLEVNCQMCHLGPAVGGTMHQKLGLVKPWETKDLGRAKETKNDADKGFFKVPGLRNIAETGPYLHDGSIASLEEVTKLMAERQLGKELTAEQLKNLITFMKALTGKVDEKYIAKPELPPSGPDTPKADNS